MTDAIHRVRQLLLLVAGMLALCGCVYDYTPRDASLPGLSSPLVVIDGDIIVGGVTRVKVALTESLFDETLSELPLGTTVMVESESGEVAGATAVGDEPGIFEADTRVLDIDGRYRLVVSIPGRGEYISDFAPVMVSPPIDGITWSFSDDGSYANVEVTTHNQESEKLYCKWNFVENWESPAVYWPNVDYTPNSYSTLKKLTPAESEARKYCWSEDVQTEICIANTEKLSENLIYKYVLKRIPNTDTRAKALYAITVTQKAISKEAYTYWETLQRNISNIGGIFSALPTEIRGNIASVGNPEEEVVGYVSVTTTTNIRSFINWEEYDFYNHGCSVFKIEENWNQMYYAGYRPFAVDDTGGTPWWSELRCVDCRSYSNSTKPDFWPR